MESTDERWKLQRYPYPVQCYEWRVKNYSEGLSQQCTRRIWESFLREQLNGRDSLVRGWKLVVGTVHSIHRRAYDHGQRVSKKII